MSASPIAVVGAGPAGLAAAITLARDGRAVVVHEAQGEVGNRFGRDLEGLENWTTPRDALDVLRDLGITTDFANLPCRSGTAFDAWDRAYAIRSDETLFYLLERGAGAHTLDTALLNQALALGVEVRFNSRVQHMEGPAIFATGPKAADAIAVGYHFDTRMDDGFWVICDDNLAPQGYAYLLVMGGRGTVKSCMFSGFKQQEVYVQRTVSAFERLTGLTMIHPQPHGGVGNFRLPASSCSGRHPVAGEQAGFQDTLWGFGMRAAITSGVLAARSLLEGDDYDARWRPVLGPAMTAALVNRAAYGLLGNRGYRWFLGLQENRSDLRARLRHYYAQSWAKRLLVPLAKWRVESRRRDESCNHIDCACVWCRCGQQTHE